jgi:ribosome-binding factor A
MTRADRVAELIKREVSDIISRKLNDPRVGFTSITVVDIGSDLRNATIHVSIFGTPEQKKDTMSALFSATKFIRGELGRRMQLRDVPVIFFKHDESLEKGSKVFEIINQLHQEEDKEPVKARKVIRRPKAKKL